MGLSGYELDGEIIVINRDLTELDIFLKEFLSVLKRHTHYLVVSGFVSISTGRTRGTEDIDVLVPALGEEEFKSLFEDLHKNNFWCYQGDTSEEIYEYINDKHNIRFAKVNERLPNIEFISVDETKKAQFFELNNPKTLRVQDFEFNIPPIEFEILYKELLLGAEKDLDDAKHLRTFFSDLIDTKKFKEYKAVIQSELDEE